MRFIAYIAIVALASVTQGMKISPDVKHLFEPDRKPIISVKGCSQDDTTIRCDSGNGNNGWKNTELCMNELGNTRECYCWRRAQSYAVANLNYDNFTECCKRRSGSSKINRC
jgi:hypothetical protein